MFENQNTNSITNLVHEKSAEILSEVGFCVPDAEALNRLDLVDFIVDRDTQMVRIPTEILEKGIGHVDVIVLAGVHDFWIGPGLLAQLMI